LFAYLVCWKTASH